jgi:hypothetical protein
MNYTPNALYSYWNINSTDVITLKKIVGVEVRERRK